MKNEISPDHWWWQSVSPVYSSDHVLVRPVPIWPLSVGDNFPHDHPITPHITGRRKLTEGYGFWGCPSHWNFPTLCEKENLLQIK